MIARFRVAGALARIVATVPRRLLVAPITLDGLVTIEAPVEQPPAVHSAWWHPRFDRDPANEGLRDQVRPALASTA